MNVFSSTSNFDDYEEEKEDITATQTSPDSADLTGVESVRDVSSQEAAEINNIVGGPSTSNSNTGTASASTSSDSSTGGNGPSRVHIQKPRAKRMTESAKQRQELTNTFIDFVKKEQERDLQPDDEIDSSFAGFAARMHKHLNEDQREDVLQEMNRVLSDSIIMCGRGYQL